jgi:4-diphosphocytidyl-2-C-methyl-D-erythritol kinase
MIVFPKAKINLGLRIRGKRTDGYHNIETIFYPVGIRDALEFVVSDSSVRKDIITVTGINTGSSPDDNLVMKTIRKLREQYSFPFLRIHLHKSIPIGAGLGGGSSDATHFLKALIKYFDLTINETNLKSITLELGSDCPFFIDETPAFATGRGEILKTINSVLYGYYLILLNPGVRIDTREAYQNCLPQEPITSLLKLIEQPVKEWKDSVLNDFEAFAFKKYPHIGEIKNELYSSGAIFSLMSGSGSSLYGIFPEKTKVPDKLKGFVIWEGIL